MTHPVKKGHDGNNGANRGQNPGRMLIEDLTIRDLSVAAGAEFTQQDVDSANKVAVLGQTPVDNLFDGADPIGQAIRIKNVPFTVVGVLTRKGQSSQGQDQDDVILLPISTAKRKVLGVKQANADAVDSIMMQAKCGAQITAAQEEATALLRQRHHLQANEADDFSIRNLEELFAAQETSSKVMAIMLAAVASVSLVVGGIGIMNIMLISVRERTREIGLRQALGAKTRDILTQFLVEAVTLAVAGGFIGILFGFGASLLISRLAGWTTSLVRARCRSRYSSRPWWVSALDTIRRERLLIWIRSRLCGMSSRWFGGLSDSAKAIPWIMQCSRKPLNQAKYLAQTEKARCSQCRIAQRLICRVGHCR